LIIGAEREGFSEVPGRAYLPQTKPPEITVIEISMRSSNRVIPEATRSRFYD
jgi:hypothetical protein